MKKLFAISLVFIYFSSTTELHEVYKLPALIEHYFEHKTENKLLSLVDFLELHYANSHANTSHKDHQLPFKSHPEMAYFASIVAIIPTIPALKQKPQLQVEKAPIVFRNILIHSSHFCTIWQPPKLI